MISAQSPTSGGRRGKPRHPRHDAVGPAGRDRQGGSARLMSLIIYRAIQASYSIIYNETWRYSGIIMDRITNYWTFMGRLWDIMNVNLLMDNLGQLNHDLTS
jgi:hypothetical protein